MQQPYTATRDNTTSVEPTLKDLVDKNVADGGHGLALDRVNVVVAPIASELDKLHARGAASGDVAPEHILVPPGRPALLAQPSGPRVADASAEGDIAALASAAYFALCGVAPSYFHHMSAGNDAQDSAAPGFLAPPSIHRPDLPPAVQDVLVNALTPASEVRYANAGAFAAALQKAARPGSGIFIPALAFRPLVSRIAAVLAAVLLLGAVLIHFASIHTAQPAVIPPAAPTASPSVGVVPPSTPVPATSRNSAVAPITVPPPVSLPSPARPRTVASAASPKTLIDTRSSAVQAEYKSSVRQPKAAVVAHMPAHQAAPSSGSLTFIRVYARQFITVSDVLRHRTRTVRARRVLVDGTPSYALATGGFALIRPGRHMLAFYPRRGVPFDPNTRYWITVKADSRRSIQIPLPRHPGYLSVASR